jgi:hypothetical protein
VTERNAGMVQTTIPAHRRQSLQRRLIMKIIQIQKAEWNGFFNSFSKKHQDWLVTVAVNNKGNPEILGDGLHLKGITFEPEKGDIVLSLSRSQDDDFTHYIHSPELITLEQTEEGADDELFIKSADGSFTEIRFVTVALPETVDGMVFS